METEKMMAVSDEEETLIRVLRSNNLTPISVLMDGQTLCNARKVGEHYNQLFFTDRWKQYGNALEEFKALSIK